MELLTASGICLAAIVGSALFESRRMKKEEKEIRELLKNLKKNL